MDVYKMTGECIRDIICKPEEELLQLSTLRLLVVDPDPSNSCIHIIEHCSTHPGEEEVTAVTNQQGEELLHRPSIKQTTPSTKG